MTSVDQVDSMMVHSGLTASIPSEGTETPEAHWAWWASRDEENYTVGPCASREEAIERAQEDFDGEAFHVVEARKGSMARWLPRAERIIEITTEASDDDGAFGENDYCELIGSTEAITAAETDLDAVLSDWFGRHSAIFPVPWAFFATRKGEWVTASTVSPAGYEGEAEVSSKTPTQKEQGA